MYFLDSEVWIPTYDDVILLSFYISIHALILIHSLILIQSLLLFTAKLFTREELMAVRPMHLRRFFNLLCFGVENPPANARCDEGVRSSTISMYKKAISYYMVYKGTPWVNNQGNPTKSAAVNDLIAIIRRFEVRGRGMYIHADSLRPNRDDELRRALSWNASRYVFSDYIRATNLYGNRDEVSKNVFERRMEQFLCDMLLEFEPDSIEYVD